MHNNHRFTVYKPFTWPLRIDSKYISILPPIDSQVSWYVYKTISSDTYIMLKSITRLLPFMHASNACILWTFTSFLISRVLLSFNKIPREFRTLVLLKTHSMTGISYAEIMHSPPLSGLTYTHIANHKANTIHQYSSIISPDFKRTKHTTH